MGLPSRSENRFCSFWMVLQRNMQIALEQQTSKTSSKTSLWVHRAWVQRPMGVKDGESGCYCSPLGLCLHRSLSPLSAGWQAATIHGAQPWHFAQTVCSNSSYPELWQLWGGGVCHLNCAYWSGPAVLLCPGATYCAQSWSSSTWGSH